MFVSMYCIVFYCTPLGTQPIGVQCLLTSSLGEFPGYWYWLWHTRFPPVLMSIAFHPSPTSMLFHSLFACHWTSFVFLLYDVSTPIRRGVQYVHCVMHKCIIVKVEGETNTQQVGLCKKHANFTKSGWNLQE